ncbi:stage III sporulation protein AE [Bengtsoniella intestinalis]|uniref:stage III sporulation protein AE n=1 Tax=Bengtsoniella intestinalis TaxID=3073143 RepID=UPI00391EE69F
MKRVILWLFIAWRLTTFAYGLDTVDTLLAALPDQTQNLIEKVELSTIDGLLEGIDALLTAGTDLVAEVVRSQLTTVALILVTVILCAMVESIHGDLKQENLALPMVGALSVSLLSAGSLESMMGLGASTIETLEVFSHVLLPTMAAATAASGAVTSATVGQVTTVFFVDLLISAINQLLLPMVYLYIGAITASAMLQKGNPMDTLASVLKRGITWLLCSGLFLFTLYLSVMRVMAGSVDGVSVKIARTTISGVVPVVGSIIADASEAVLSGLAC